MISNLQPIKISDILSCNPHMTNSRSHSGNDNHNGTYFISVSNLSKDSNNDDVITPCQYATRNSISNDYIDKIIHTSFTAGYSSEDNTYTKFRLKLYSYANIPIVGSGVYRLSHSGKTVDVSAYNPDYESKYIPIVNAALKYDSSYDRKTYILAI